MQLNFVTHNEHKFKEALELANKFKINVKWYNLEYEESQNDSLEVIAKKSCEFILKEEKGLSESSFFLEDAGLFINSLNGFPGPYSSFIFKKIGNKGILKLMEENRERTAEFRSSIAYYSMGEIKIFAGVTQGRISKKMIGDLGFGYDPIFIPKKSKLSYAQMDIKLKNIFSHRQKALSQLFKHIKPR